MQLFSTICLGFKMKIALISECIKIFRFFVLIFCKLYVVCSNGDSVSELITRYVNLITFSSWKSNLCTCSWNEGLGKLIPWFCQIGQIIKYLIISLRTPKTIVNEVVNIYLSIWYYCSIVLAYVYWHHVTVMLAFNGSNWYQLKLLFPSFISNVWNSSQNS